jgi:hypothetical protein
MKMSPDYLFAEALSAMARLGARLRRLTVNPDQTVMGNEEVASYWLQWQAYAIGMASR